MAEHSQAAKMIDPSEPPGQLAAIGEMAGIRGNITRYNLLKKLHEESFQKCKEVAKQFKEEEEKLEILTKEISELSEELCSLKKQSPEVASLLSDFTPFRDIPLQAVLLDPQHTGGFSVTKEMLKAASDMNPNDRNELMEAMLQNKAAEVERLQKELKHSKSHLELQEEKIKQLNVEIAKLKVSMSPVSSSVELSSAGDVQMMKPLDTPSPTELHTAVDVATLDPAVMQEKIKQLTSRISELMNHNLQWKNRCDALMREVEDANRHLEEYKQLTEQKLLEEREKTSRAEAERDDALADAAEQRDLCRQLTEQFERLEATIHELECRDNSKDIENVYQIQVEEFQHALDAERQSHERTKHNKESLDKQLDTMLQELKEKNNQLDQAKAEKDRLQKETERCHELLQKAQIDKEMIEGRLIGRGQTAWMMPGDKSTDDQRSSHLQSPVTSSKGKKVRSTLEEDSPFAITETVRRVDRVEQWTCDVCSYYNTGNESLNACKRCTANKGRVVSQSVQESGAMSANTKQVPVTCNAMTVGSSSSKVGRSRLEEDGVPSRILHVVY